MKYHVGRHCWLRKSNWREIYIIQTALDDNKNILKFLCGKNWRFYKKHFRIKNIEALKYLQAKEGLSRNTLERRCRKGTLVPCFPVLKRTGQNPRRSYKYLVHCCYTQLCNGSCETTSYDSTVTGWLVLHPSRVPSMPRPSDRKETS